MPRQLVHTCLIDRAGLPDLGWLTERIIDTDRLHAATVLVLIDAIDPDLPWYYPLAILEPSDTAEPVFVPLEATTDQRWADLGAELLRNEFPFAAEV